LLSQLEIYVLFNFLLRVSRSECRNWVFPLHVGFLDQTAESEFKELFKV
jgi:hypothetical protein